MEIAHGKRGQAAVELALLLPLLLLILLGCLDLGRAFSVRMALANGSREGARYASLHPTDSAGIVSRARADILAEGLAASALTIQVSTPAGITGGSPVVVTALYDLPLTTTYLFANRPLAISARTQMVIVGGQ